MDGEFAGSRCPFGTIPDKVGFFFGTGGLAELVLNESFFFGILGGAFLCTACDSLTSFISSSLSLYAGGSVSFVLYLTGGSKVLDGTSGCVDEE